MPVVAAVAHLAAATVAAHVCPSAATLALLSALCTHAARSAPATRDSAVRATARAVSVPTARCAAAASDCDELRRPRHAGTAESGSTVPQVL